MPESGPAPAIVVGDPTGLVIAVAKGIGRAAAAAFATPGARAQTTDIPAAAVGDAVSGDASLPRDVHLAVADVRARFEGFDVLVKNVGIAGSTGRVGHVEYL